MFRETTDGKHIFGFVKRESSCAVEESYGGIGMFVFISRRTLTAQRASPAHTQLFLTSHRHSCARLTFFLV